MSTCQHEFLRNKTSGVNLISLSDGWDSAGRDKAAGTTYLNVTEAPDIVPCDICEHEDALAEVLTEIWLECTLWESFPRAHCEI